MKNEYDVPPPYWMFFLIGLIVIMSILMVSGCVSIATHERIVHETRLDAYQRAAQFMARYNCEDAKWLVRSAEDVEELKR